MTERAVLEYIRVIPTLAQGGVREDKAIAFISRSGDTFSVGIPTDKIAEIINLKSADVIEQIENVDIPNLTLGYGV